MENKVSVGVGIMRNRIFNIALLCLFVLCAGIYNYGLHRSFWFDCEYSFSIYEPFLKEYYGLNIDLSGIYFFLAYIPYRLFGCTLKALRVYAAIIYQFIILFCVIAAIYSFERKKIEWYKLGIFAFIAVILHPGSSPFCGHYSTNFHQYPYDMHAAPIIAATFSIMLLCLHQGMTKRKYKNILKVIILAVIVLGYKMSDFLYIIGFVGPLVCVGLIYLWREKRKLFFALAFGVIAVLALLHVISFVVPSLEPLFDHIPIDGYGAWVDGSTVYGNNGFTDLREIWSNISNTTVELLALFNIDIIGKSMLSIGTLIAGFRLILVIFMFVCCFKTVIDAIRKKDEYQSLDPINIVLALGIIFNFFVVMLSDYGDEPRCIRYMTLILFYGSIFLARQSESIIVKIHGELDNRSKLYFFLFFSLAIITNMTTFWKKDDYTPDYEFAYRNVSSYIIENHLGNGVGGHGYASILTILGEGNYAVVDGAIGNGSLQLHIDGFDEVPATFNYIIDWVDAYNDIDTEVLYQYLGKPDAVIEESGFVIYYYADGFGI